MDQVRRPNFTSVFVLVQAVLVDTAPLTANGEAKSSFSRAVFSLALETVRCLLWACLRESVRHAET